MIREEIIQKYSFGERDFRNADLSNANLRAVDLRGADLRGADLSDAYLRVAYLSRANLREAYLTGANISEGDLSGAYLSYANISYANFSKSNLSEADLSGANLSYANLSYANFEGAILTNTILDPTNSPNGICDEFEKIRTRNNSEWCIGYRTKRSSHIGSAIYNVGDEYKAPIFSTCPNTKCHPGLYVSPTVNWLIEQNYKDPFVKVIFRQEECHKVGDKYRVRWFIVVEDI